MQRRMERDEKQFHTHNKDAQKDIQKRGKLQDGKLQCQQTVSFSSNEYTGRAAAVISSCNCSHNGSNDIAFTVFINNIHASSQKQRISQRNCNVNINGTQQISAAKQFQNVRHSTKRRQEDDAQ